MTTILVVEDYVVTQRVLSHTLRKNGYTVIIADNGIDALARLAESKMDLAIIDIAMPEMDGISLLRHLRNNDIYHNLPVIMLTASGQDEDRVLARAEGANEFLTKPASSHQLVEMVKHLLD